MPAGDPLIGMNLSSSQMELVQRWGLGHSGPQVQSISVKELHNTSEQDAECTIAKDRRNCRLWQYKESSKEVSETVYM
jgi:hypothetical protein